jgi:aminoglycoside phosphotransferase (APT) family kinase protein
VLAHGELHTKHVLVDGNVDGPGVTGIVDWESVSWSWPGADIGQIEFWRRLMPARLETYATHLFDAYRNATPHEIDPRAVRYSSAAAAISTVEFYASNRVWEALRWCLPTARQVLTEALD